MEYFLFLDVTHLMIKLNIKSIISSQWESPAEALSARSNGENLLLRFAGLFVQLSPW